MTNNRRKGKRIERWFSNQLKSVFPTIRRNAGTQSQSGGVDLENTGPFNMEVKGGKRYKSKMVRKMLDQIEEEGNEANWDVVLVKPDREKPYILMPFTDWMEVIKVLKHEGII